MEVLLLYVPRSLRRQTLTVCDSPHPALSCSTHCNWRAMEAPVERRHEKALVFYWIYLVLVVKIGRLKTCVIRCVVAQRFF